MDLNQVTVPSTDIDRSIAFYQRLGLSLIVHSGPHYARFECPDGGATFSLHLVDSRPAQPGPWVYFEVEQLDELVAELAGAGIEFSQLPTDQPWLWREAHLSDPDGNRLILYHAGDKRRHPPWRLADD